MGGGQILSSFFLTLLSIVSRVFCTLPSRLPAQHKIATLLELPSIKSNSLRKDIQEHFIKIRAWDSLLVNTLELRPPPHAYFQ